MGNSSLKQRFMKASVWLLAGYGLTQVIRLFSSLVLTRLLAPDMYGVMSVGYTVIVALIMLSDLGLAAIAVRSERGDDPLFLDVVWVVQIARGVVITALCLLVAAASAWGAGVLFPVDSVYADPRIPGMLAAVSIVGIISGFESTKAYWARRHLSMAGLTKIEVASQLASTVFLIGLAYIWPSVWALAAGWIFGAVIKTVLTHTMLPGPENKFRWEPSAWREIFDFGKWTIVSSTLSFLLTNCDRLLLGLFLGSLAMGQYAIALVLLAALQSAVSKLVGHAALPALSEVFRDRPAQLKETFYRMRLPLDAVCLIAAGALVFMGEPLIRLLYDPRYLPAGWMLAVVGMVLFANRLDVFDQCLIAMGRTGLLSIVNGVRLLVMCIALPLGYKFYGAEGAIIAVSVSAVINALFILLMQHRTGLFEWRRELLAIPLLGTGLALGYAASLAATPLLDWLGT